MPDPIPAAAGATLYPDGGNNPEGNPAAAIDPATGQPKFSAPAPAAAAAEPAKPAEPAAPAEPAKTAEEPKPAEAKPAEPAAPLDLAPYAELKLPEAFAVDDATLTNFKTVAAELGVPADGAKKLLDLYASVATKQVEQLAAAAQAESVKQNDAWVNEIKTMPEFQGEALERNSTFLARMMDEFGTPELKDYLNTGPGNHPGLVKMILAMGQALIEGEPTPIGQPGSLAGPKPNGAAVRKTAGSILYGDNAA